MNGRMKWTMLAALAAWGLVFVGAAQAALVPYQKVAFIKDTDYFSEAFTIDTAGTYQATLTDFNFPSDFGQVALDVTTAVATEGSLIGPGSFVFDAEPGTYYASVYGVGGGALNLGLLGVQVEATSTAITSSPVPLPASLVLLLSGLAVLGPLERRRRADSNGPVTKES